MKISLVLAFAVFLVDSVLVEESTDEKEYAEPEHLDDLLQKHSYKEFSRLMHISNPRLSMPRNASDKNDPAAVDPSFIRGLFEGDILLAPELEEMARQGMDFSKEPAFRWPAVIPYVISSKYSSSYKSRIEEVIKIWNGNVQCLRYTPRTNQRDYVYFFPGDGCYSYLGRIGGQQPISLGDGCSSRGTILHEMSHAVGVIHEQSRPDRDNYVVILWDNIPKNWQRQYQKESANLIGIQGEYECSSVMHYPNRAPGTNKAAFVWKNNSCKNPEQVGQRLGQTPLDILKIKRMYSCS